MALSYGNIEHTDFGFHNFHTTVGIKPHPGVNGPYLIEDGVMGSNEGLCGVTETGVRNKRMSV